MDSVALSYYSECTYYYRTGVLLHNLQETVREWPRLRPALKGESFNINPVHKVSDKFWSGREKKVVANKNLFTSSIMVHITDGN